MAELDAVLDVRSKRETPEKSPVTRLPLIEREFQRAIYRYLEHLPESFAAADETRRAAYPEIDAVQALRERLTESTYHPSQNLPILFYKYLAMALKGAWDRHKNDPAGRRSPAAMEKEAEEILQIVLGQTEDQLSNLRDAAISSNASLNKDDIERVQTTLEQRLNALLVRKEMQTGWSPREHAQELLATISEEELQSAMDRIRVEPSPGRFDESGKTVLLDESWETVLEAKTILLNNVEKELNVWIDFDGSRRAEGHAYTKYGALIYEDIARNLKCFDSKELGVKEVAEVDVLYAKFRKNAAWNHAITTKLADPANMDPSTIRLMERTLDILKGERYEELNQMIRMLNEVKQKNSADGKDDLLYLSDRVKFMPRLDHRTIVAATIAQHDPGALSPQQQAHHAALRNILNQVLEINQLAQETRLWKSKDTLRSAAKASIIVPEIMIAECRGWDDIRALKLELELARNRKYEERPGDYSTQIALVPLFESEETVAPEIIREYLKKAWAYYADFYKDQGLELFNQNISEVFIAGSDLSKEIGQTSALVMAWDAIGAIVAFNKEHGTDVRLKLGAGEAPFRQGGFWDPEGYLPLIRGKIIDYKPLSDEEAMLKFGKESDWQNMRAEEERVVAEEQEWLRQTLGEDWREALNRKPRGYNRLFDLLKGMSFVTEQSRAKELTMTTIHTDRLRQMTRQARAMRDEGLKMVRDGEFQEVPAALKNAARYEKQMYQGIFGGGDRQKTMYGQLLEFCGKSLRAPELRDRGLGRVGAPQDIAAFFSNLAKPHIDARAISANTVSGYLFPLFLIGKGTMLAGAKERGELEKVMQNGQIDAKELLRQMNLYEAIADDVFTMLRKQGMEADATQLKGEWNKLIVLRPDIEEELWKQMSTDKVDFSSLTNEQKLRLARMFVPGTRELVDRTFESDRKKVFQAAFIENRDLIDLAMEYVHLGSRAAGAVGSNIEEMRARLAANTRLAEVRKILDSDEFAERYGKFLAVVVTCYSPGM